MSGILKTNVIQLQVLNGIISLENEILDVLDQVGEDVKLIIAGDLMLELVINVITLSVRILNILHVVVIIVMIILKDIENQKIRLLIHLVTVF